LPTVDVPHLVFGDSDTGTGRGPGKPGDVFKKDPAKGQGKGGASDEEGEGILVSVPVDYLVDELAKDCQLPPLKPKPTQTFEDIKIKYNNIALTGPESLRHNRKTILQALKRQAATGELDKLHDVPGYANPIKLIKPINRDRRYRQYKEIKIPSSQAVIQFGRDCSGSMSDEHCEIVSDMAFWIDKWIRRHYENIQVCYYVHDAVAKEVDEETFYRYRRGGGTKCSTCLKEMAKEHENRFPPDKWNIYCFYFTDGDNLNWNGLDDNIAFIESLKEDFKPEVCNLFGITQVMPTEYKGSVKEAVDAELSNMSNVRTASVGKDSSLADAERDEAIKDAIKALLSKPESEIYSVL
jgi:uncharacterized protein